MSATYVAAVDQHGEGVWLDQYDSVIWLKPGDEAPAGWRRLYVREEPAAFEHSDRCEDGHARPHLDSQGACNCCCPKCDDGEGFCVCPACARPTHHAHRPVTS